MDTNPYLTDQEQCEREELERIFAAAERDERREPDREERAPRGRTVRHLG